MAVSEKAGNTQTATGSEDTLATITDAGTYVLVVDTANMAAGDIVVLRLKTKARSGGTSRVAYAATYAHVQAEPQKYSVPVPANIELVATLHQTAGSSRNFPWAILAL